MDRVELSPKEQIAQAVEEKDPDKLFAALNTSFMVLGASVSVGSSKVSHTPEEQDNLTRYSIRRLFYKISEVEAGRLGMAFLSVPLVAATGEIINFKVITNYRGEKVFSGIANYPGTPKAILNRWEGANAVTSVTS